MRASLKSVDCIIEIHDARISFHVSNYILKKYLHHNITVNDGRILVSYETRVILKT